MFEIIAENAREDLLATTLFMASAGAIASVGLVASVVFPPVGLLAAGISFCVGISRLGQRG